MMDVDIYAAFSSIASSLREEIGLISFGNKHRFFNGIGISHSDFSLDLCLESSNMSSVILWS
jgi:hypothetical protein